MESGAGEVSREAGGGEGVGGKVCWCCRGGDKVAGAASLGASGNTTKTTESAGMRPDHGSPE